MRPGKSRQRRPATAIAERLQRTDQFVCPRDTQARSPSVTTVSVVSDTAVAGLTASPPMRTGAGADHPRPVDDRARPRRTSSAST